jgi:SHS2 domain-containing protein
MSTIDWFQACIIRALMKKTLDKNLDKKNYELFSHGADVGIRGRGMSLEEAFQMAALALTAVISDPKNVEQEIQIKIELHENDLELLFLDWINSIIYEMDTNKMLFSSFDISVKEGSLHAVIKGEKINQIKHDPAVEIKGATLTELKVIHEGNIWTAQCVVDV